MEFNKSIFEKDIKNLLLQIGKLHKIDTKDNYLLENTYFLDDGRILCQDRLYGVSRFPYGKDGFTLWAYSSGHISINESTFYLVLPSEEGKEPYLGFFGGEKQKDSSFIPISILGRANNPLEKDVERYCVYSKDCVYYITKTRRAIYACRAFVSDNKEVSFSLYLENRSKKEHEFYLSSYFNCLFKYSNGESIETKWFKKCLYKDNCFSFESPEDLSRHQHLTNFGLIKRELLNKPSLTFNTTSRSVYMGGKENQLINSLPLRKGYFDREKNITHFTDTSIGGDILHFKLKSKEKIIVNYVMTFSHDEIENNRQKNNKLSFEQVEKLIKKRRYEIKRKENDESMLKISFEEWNNSKLNSKIFNRFLEYIIYQTEYCGLAKNSGALFLGVRDVMQQIEAALIWNPKACRSKILEVVSFIDPSGVVPRQYSLPPQGVNPKMDYREFIDQGLWIITTIYAYLGYTMDYKILDEVIGYYERTPNGYGILSNKKDTLLDHLLRIMDYLIAHLDSNTRCLRAMYGDWNDALDGLGVSSCDKYGDGVSVMASLQFYRNLKEMCEILTKINKHHDYIDFFVKTKHELKEGLRKYAIVEKDGHKKIVHGWGEHRSYLIGSFLDVDNASRSSCTANAFYVISGLYLDNDISKEDILSAYHNLDSKYGFKTFEPYFSPNCKGVGRIVNLPKGTAENGATYIHAALFATLSLFYLNEEKYAYEQLEKLLPITHKTLSTSPFVMPNSYSYNIEEDMDGESMSDWYTGSANTLLKTIIKGIFGIEVTLDNIIINASRIYPSKKASINFNAQKHNIKINYVNYGNKKREVMINNKRINCEKIIIDKKYEGIKNIFIEIND